MTPYPLRFFQSTPYWLLQAKYGEDIWVVKRKEVLRVDGNRAWADCFITNSTNTFSSILDFIYQGSSYDYIPLTEAKYEVLRFVLKPPR